MNKIKRLNLTSSLIILGLFIVVLVISRNLQTKTKETPILVNDTPQQTSNCGLLTTAPGPNETVGQNFPFSVIIDNSNRETLGCSWTVFEAQAGVVYVKDISDKDIADPTPLTTTMEWMTTEPVIYNANIQIKNNYRGKANLVIKEDDPSGEKIPKIVTIPITVE